MQFEQTKTFQPQNEALDTREQVKLEGREVEEDQPASQTSTLQSLGDVGEHTPKSSEILQKVFHKTADAIATSVEAIKNLVLVDQTKLEQEGSNIGGEIKQKAQEIKGKVTEKFGAEVQPEKDLDKEVKEQIKEVNEEIKHQPHGEEEVVEGQGQAKPGKKDEQGSGFGGEIKQKVEEIKGKVTEKFGAEVQPQKDLDKEVKEHVKEVNEEIRHQPHGEEQVVEGQGQGKPGKEDDKGFADKDLRFAPKELLDKALEKIEEMREQPHEGHEHHQLTTESPSFRPTEETHQLIEAVKEGLEEHVPLTEKVQELESHKQESPQKEKDVKENVKEGVKEVTEKINEKVQDVKEGFEQKKEEIPVEERKPIIDKVFDSVHKSVEDVKNVFKVEERTDDRKPIVDVVTGTIQDVQSKISHGIETVKEGIHNIPQTISAKLGQGKEKIKEEDSEEK